MNLKALIIFLLFLGWSFGSGWFYLSKIKRVLDSDTSSTHAQAKPSIMFYSNSSEPNVSDDFEAYKEALLAELGDFGKLSIVGLYDPSEFNLSDLENLGEARALEVRSLFPSIDDSRISITSEERVYDENLSKHEGVILEVDKNEALVKSENGATLDYYQLSDVKVEAYLTFLSIEQADKQIEVVGYAQDIEELDERIGVELKMANNVVAKLVTLGYDHSLISVSSSEVNSSNSTENEAINRKVELLIK